MSIRRKNILKQRGIKQISTKVYDKFGPYSIIIKPLSSEKVYSLNNIDKYVFHVHSDANANDVKRSFELAFGIVPIKVNIMNMPEKNRYRRTVKKSLKKAIITVNKGDKVEII